MNNIYKDGTYLETNPTWHEEDSAWKAEQIIKILERNALAPESVCEVGCGAGEILLQLSRKFSETRFDGYEISPQAFAICQPKAHNTLTFYHQDLLSSPDEVHFDLVMAIDVFEHVEDYLGFLRGLKSRGEYKLFHIPLDISVQAVLRSSPVLHARRAIGHIHQFTKETALEALNESGLEVLDWFYTGGSLGAPNLPASAKLMKLPRRLAFSINQDLAARILGGFSLMVLAR